MLYWRQPYHGGLLPCSTGIYIIPIMYFTLFFFFSKVFKAKRFNVDMAEFPVISRLYERLCQLQPFIEAHPDNQIDSPTKSK